jgi:thymidylate synthase (FAD)
MTEPTIYPINDGIGFVRLDACLANDLDVVNAARVSLNKHHDKMEDGDDKLISYLLRNRHGTPFEQNYFRFHVKAPIFVFREWHRHRIGWSYNEWSARYSELKPEFYIPRSDHVRTQTGKPGHYKYETIDSVNAEGFQQALERSNKDAFTSYQYALAQGVAKEQARFFLPVNIYSEMYASCNARSLMSFLSLRSAKTAMWEIRMYSQTLERFFQVKMPITYQAFMDNERIAP